LKPFFVTLIVTMSAALKIEANAFQRPWSVCGEHTDGAGV
jgi:hypothetical protein